MIAQNSSGSGDWDLTSTWSGGAVPSATGTVVILNGHTVSIDANHTCANLTINAGGSLVVKSGAGARTLTITSTNTSTGNFVINGTLDLAEGADSVNVLMTSAHNNTKTLGGTGSITFNSLSINHSASTNALTAGASGISGSSLTGRINTVGNLNVERFLNLQRGVLILGTTTDGTQTHTIGQVRVGSSASNLVASDFFCLSVTLTANTVLFLNNGVRTITTVKVAGDVVSDNTIGASASNGVNISMTGPDARGGTIASADVAPPTTSKTKLEIAGSLILNKQSSIGGNGVFSSAGTTQPMDSMIIDIGKNFIYTSVPTLSRCSQTFKLAYVGYAGGFGHSQVSYPVFKLRGGTEASPAILNVNPEFWTTLNSHAADATCHWRIEQGAYVQLSATSGLCIREGRTIRINGTLDMVEGAQLVSRQVGTCSGTGGVCPEPSLTFGTLGKIVLRDAQGIGDGTVSINTATRPAFTVSGTGARFVTISGMASGGQVEYVGGASQVITPRSYFKLRINNPGLTISPVAGTYTISNNGELRLVGNTTFRLNPAGTTAWSIGATGTTLVVPATSELRTDGININGFANYSNGIISGARGKTQLSTDCALLSGTIRMNGATADEVVPAAAYENLIVDKGTFSANLSTDTAVMRGSLQVQTGKFGFGASGTLLLEKGFNDLGSGPTGTLTGSTTANLIIGGSATEPAFTMPAITSSVLARLTVNRTLGVTNAIPLALNNGLYLTNGPLTISSAGNLSISNNSTIFRTTGTIDVSPTILATCNLTYQGPATVTTGPEFTASTMTALTISAGANVTQSGNKTLLGNLVVSAAAAPLAAGIYSIGANTLELNSATATITSSGTINGGATSNLNLSGSTATAITLPLITGGLNNLTINRPLTLGTSASLTVGGVTTFTANRTITIGTNTFVTNGTFSGTGSFTGSANSILTVGGSGALGGTVTWPVSLSTLNYNRSGASMLFGASTHTTVNHNAGSTLAYSAAATITNLNISGASVMTTSNSLSSNVILISGNSSLTMNTAGTGTFINFDLEAGSTFSALGRTVSFNGVLNMAGTILHNATSNFTIGDQGGAQAQWSWPATLKPFTGTININRAAGALFGSAGTVTSLVLQSGQLTHGGNLTIANAGTITRSLGSMDVAPIFAGTATAVYGTGTTANITTGPELRSSITALTINMGANGAVTLDKNVTATALTFTTGCLRLGVFDLSMASAAAISGLTAVRYIEADGTGGFIRTGISGAATLTTPILFPIGTSVSGGGSYSPVRIGNTAALTVKARVRDFICTSNATTCGSSVANTVKKTWEVDIISGTPTATFDVGWTAAAETGTFNRANPLGLFRFNSGTGRWVQSNATSVTAITNTVATARITGKTQFSPHGMANQGGVLPVVISSLNAVREGNHGRLDWSTALEQNNKGWSVEKSTDGHTYEPIGFVNGASSTAVPQAYTYLDENLVGTAYYRLKQEDFDGTTEYSKVVSIASANIGGVSFNLFPNPSRGVVRLAYAGVTDPTQQYTVSLYGPTGKQVGYLIGTIEEVATFIEQHTSNLVAGIYQLRIADNNQVLNLKVVRE